MNLVKHKNRSEKCFNNEFNDLDIKIKYLFNNYLIFTAYLNDMKFE